MKLEAVEKVPPRTMTPLTVHVIKILDGMNQGEIVKLTGDSQQETNKLWGAFQTAKKKYASREYTLIQRQNACYIERKA